MNREIKFRAWDKKTKKMRAVNSIAFHYEHEAFDYDNSRLPKVVNLWGTQIIGEYAPKEVIIHRDIKQVELMQYTGLKDKNGKEIYEGDIVKFMYLNMSVPEERIMFVELVGLGDGMSTRVISAYSPFCYTVGGSYLTKDRESADVFLTPPSESEIIGNIYESKHLLDNTDMKV